MPAMLDKAGINLHGTALLRLYSVAMQAGVWDVDGTGMQAIEDPEVDLGIRKVGQFPMTSRSVYAHYISSPLSPPALFAHSHLIASCVACGKPESAAPSFYMMSCSALRLQILRIVISECAVMVL